jgi:hypothetical protein
MSPRRPKGTAATVVLAAAMLGGALAPSASAATLHVSPYKLLKGSTVLPCTSDRPCNLAFALANAGAGDDVAMRPGNYRPPVLNVLQTQAPYAESLVVKAGVVLHGEPGAALPVIHSRVPAIAPAVRVSTGGVLRDVAIEATAPAGANVNYGYGATIEPNALVERSRIRWTGVAGTVGTACAMVGGTVRNSECLGTGAAGYAHALTGTGSDTVTYTVRNVTAVTTNPVSHGLRVGTSKFVATMIASNVIARGPAADLSVRVGLSGGVATMVVDHSNWTTQETVATSGGTAQLIPGAGNQTGPTAAAPLFADAASGDYRSLEGSPTIDAGIADAVNGPLALGGRPRTVGAATDIGADEFAPSPPPVAPTTPGAGNPAAGPGTAPVAAPLLTRLRMGRSWTRRAGTTIRFTLSEAATVSLAFSRRTSGRRIGRICRPTTDANRAKTRCTRTTLRGTRLVKAKAGANTITFSERLLGRLLTPGPHLMKATATDSSGLLSTPRTVRFSITR